MPVHPKKFLGQHFLKDEEIAQKIVKSLPADTGSKVLEIGPGMGVLTKYLFLRKDIDLSVIEIDRQSVSFLQKEFPEYHAKIIHGDFLAFDFKYFSSEPFHIIGNFPYNISSQILFRVYENKEQVISVVGMFQREVAQRIASAPGNKSYGILSVLLQTCFDIEYLFTVNESVFNPPPKVKSGVIRLLRNKNNKLICNETIFKETVKTAFNQRRKMLSNALKTMQSKYNCLSPVPYGSKRAEQLSWQQFMEIALYFQQAQ